MPNKLDTPEARERRYAYEKGRSKLPHVIAWKKAYREKNRDLQNKQHKAYYEANKERLSAQRKQHYAANKEKLRQRVLARKYGISPEEYKGLLKEQGGACAICKSTDPKMHNTQRFNIDHCHKTGKVQGLLCAPCNVGLGHFNDSVQSLKTASDYLERHK